MNGTNSKPQAPRRLRLRPLNVSDLPPHPGLAEAQRQRSKPVDLKAFVHEVLTEGVEFSDSVIPSSFHKRGSPKASPPSTAKVQLLTSDLIKGESWFARQSVHSNEPVNGSASWEEFEQGLYDSHSIREMEYTPTVFEAHKVVDWAGEIEAIGEEFGGEFEEVVMESMSACRNVRFAS